VLFLLAVGLSITLGVTKLVNVAHGVFAAAGGYAAVILVNRHGVPFAAVLPLAFVVAALAGLVLERALYVHVYGKSHLDQVAFTAGLVFVSAAAFDHSLGAQAQAIQLPGMWAGQLQVFAIGVEKYSLLIVAIGGLVFAGLQIGFVRTRSGARLRALIEDRRVACALGINADVVASVAFAAGSGLAGLGGALGAGIVGLDPTFPIKVLLYLLAVAALGGMSSLRGPFVAALVLGLAETAGRHYAPQLGAFVIYLMIVVVLIWRPQGLFAGETPR
jgi:branched-chain amino acid transport system permease protein